MSSNSVGADADAASHADVDDPGATCEALVEVFMRASDDELRQRAIAHPNMTERAIESIFLKGGEPSKAMLRLCDRPRLLMLWALSPRATVRALVAANPHTPAAVLEELAEDRDESVRAAAAVALRG